MNFQNLSLTHRQPEIIQPNSLQALLAQPCKCVIPRGEYCISEGQSIRHHHSSPPCLHTLGYTAHPLSVLPPCHTKSLSSALTAGMSSSRLWASPSLDDSPTHSKSHDTERNPTVPAAKYLQKKSWELRSVSALRRCLSLGLNKCCDGCYWGAQQGLQPHHQQPPLSKNFGLMKTCQQFQWIAGVLEGIYWERVRYHLLYKKRKCHKKALELLRLPPAARNVPGVQGHSKHQEGHWFCL